MKKKLILIALIGAIFSVIIYFYTKSDELTLVTIGDGLSMGMTPYEIEGMSFNDYLKEDLKNFHKLKNYYEFAKNGITVKELISDIKENKSLTFQDNQVEIQHAINEADILTVAIGMDELASVKITKKVRDEFKEDLEELLSMIKLLNNYKVIVLGLYEYQDKDPLTIAKMNAIIRDISLTNGFLFLDINDILKDKRFYLNKESYYINYLGHEKIYQELKKLVQI